VLGVPRDSSSEDIKKAFHRRARELHPDLNPGIDRSHFQRLQQAFSVLSNPASRAEYDLLLQTGGAFERLEPLMRAGRFEDAFAAAHEILAQAETADLLLMVATACIETGRIHLALDYLCRAEAIAPDNLFAKAQRAGTYLQMGYFQAALDIVERVRPRWDELPPLAEIAASSLANQGRFREATQAYNAARELFGDVPWIVIPHGLVAAEDDDFETSEGSARWVVEHLNELPVDARQFAIMLFLAMVHLLVRRHRFEEGHHWVYQAQQAGLDWDTASGVNNQLTELQRLKASDDLPGNWRPGESLFDKAKEGWHEYQRKSAIEAEAKEIEALQKEILTAVGKDACALIHSGEWESQIAKDAYAAVCAKLKTIEELEGQLREIDNRERPDGILQSLLDAGGAAIKSSEVKSKIAGARTDIDGIYMSCTRSLFKANVPDRWKGQAARLDRLSFELDALRRQMRLMK